MSLAAMFEKQFYYGFLITKMEIVFFLIMTGHDYARTTQKAPKDSSLPCVKRSSIHPNSYISTLLHH
jgi:hypothetical protein